MKVVKKCLFTSLLFVGLIGGVSAQSSKVEIKVKSIEITAVSEPSVGDKLDNSSSLSKSKIKWTAFFVRYEIKIPETRESKILDSGNWADTLELNWQMAYKAKKASAKKPSSYKKFSRIVKYKNIKAGEHVATLLIEPSVLERYLEKGKNLKKELKLKFSAKVNGKSVQSAISYFVDGKIDNKKSKAVNSIIMSEEVRTLEGVLLTKNETPFNNVQSAAFDRVVEDKK